MIGMNLAGGLQAMGLEGAGAFAGRDKATAAFFFFFAAFLGLGV